MSEHNLSAVALDLMTATERMNAQIEEVEELFRGLKLGVSASVPISSEEGLGFGKLDGSWRLMHVTYTGGGEHRQPLANASRVQRVRVLGALSALFDELILEVKRQTIEVEAAAEAANKFVLKLKGIQR